MGMREQRSEVSGWGLFGLGAFLFYIFCFTLCIIFTGCFAKKQVVKPQEPVKQVVEEKKEEPVELPVEKPAEEPSLRGKDYKKVQELETIYFDYNDATLKADARNVLAKNSAYLKKNKDVEIIVEGNCDERGTTDYNIALGDRRAKSVRSYLMKLGIKGSRIATISYGEEKPVATGHDEASWSKNRRADMLGRIPENGKK